MSLTIKQREYIRIYKAKWRRKVGIPTREDINIRNISSFLQNSKIIHNGKYDYCKVNYKNRNTKVIIVCPIHGDFKQSPYAHQQGQGCPICGMGTRHNNLRKPLSKFIKEIKKIHNNKYTYINILYINNHTKITITCPEHGNFKQTPKAHLKGQGCPICANEKRSLFYESRGERLIQEQLIKYNIVFIKQKTFEDCKYKMLLRYDFYLPNFNTLIEYDGEQHYTFIPKFHGTKDGLKLTQRRDKIKNDYAVKNNIVFIRIRWDEEEKIEDTIKNIVKQY